MEPKNDVNDLFYMNKVMFDEFMIVHDILMSPLAALQEVD